MKKFLIQVASYSFLLLILNIAFGWYLQTFESRDLKEKNAFFPAMRWEEYYALKDSIDVLVLGSSHAYRAYDPRILEEKTAISSVFNFGSSGQTPATGYFILEEVLEKHRPKIVLMDVFVMVFTADKTNVNGRINLLSMEASTARNNFFWEGFSTQQKLGLTLFPSYLYRGYLELKIKKALGLRYQKRSDERYEYKGFVSTQDTIPITELLAKAKQNTPSTDLSFITEESLKYLEKIKNRCAEEGIQFVMMAAPIPEVGAKYIGVYDQAFMLFNSLAQQWDVPYYDHIHHRLTALKDDEHYYDDHHLNVAGASIYSEQVAKHLNTILK